VATTLGANTIGFNVSAHDPDFVFDAVNITIVDTTQSGVLFFAGNLKTIGTKQGGCGTINATALWCLSSITQMPSWFSIIFYNFSIPNASTAGPPIRSIVLVINDLNNVDYRPGHNLTDTVVLNVSAPATSSSISVSSSPSGNNSTLIGAAIGGALAGALVFALVFWLRPKNQSSAIDDYFDRMAIDLSGTAQDSPLVRRRNQRRRVALVQGVHVAADDAGHAGGRRG